MRLLIDAGNTAIKWAVERDGRLSRHGRLLYRDGPDADRDAGPDAGPNAGADAGAGTGPGAGDGAARRFARLAETILDQAGEGIASVWIANVAGRDIENALRTVLAARCGQEPGFAQVQARGFGLHVAYAEPRRLGVDRWLAMIAGVDGGALPILVADLGTALTVDAVDAGGRHLGGLIAPGRRLMCESLIANTSDIAEGLAGGTLPEIFAADTATAVSAGAAHGVLALVVHARAALARRLDQPVRMLATGGDAGLIASAIPDCEHQPDLVLRGLARYAAAA